MVMQLRSAPPTQPPEELKAQPNFSVEFYMRPSATAGVA
jgi:hypothetical protein